jgi:putative membrane-bound dehydrogenase-like protein
LHDSNFDVEGARKVIAAARPIYALLAAADNLQVRYPDAPHDFPPAERHESYQFIDRILNHAPREDFASELPRIAPREPAEALATFQVVEGFRIEQVAAEPLVASPVAMAFDADGRLYVVEMRDYSEQDKERLGRVRLLEDSDGDGRFDKATIFADDLSWPTAVTCWDGGVFVGAAPVIHYLKDNDGDGKADERRVVYSGFSRTNVQGLLNSFQWTLDNRIHGSASSNGGLVTRPDVADFKAVSVSGRDFSFDPRTLALRSESGGAQHGMTFDDWGRKFVCSNSDHIQMVMFEDRYLARNPAASAPSSRTSIAADGPQAEVFRTSPIEPWRIVRTRLRVTGKAPGPIEGGGRAGGYFTGATGTTIYRGDAWPAEFAGQSFTGDVGSNIVHRKILEPDGVGFVARRADKGREFVASSDNWFRPAQFANGPDGALYVIDVYREVIEHPASLPPEIKKHLDLTSGRDRGRIYRIVPNDFRARPPARLSKMSTEELIAQLESRNGWTRDTASRLVYERQDRAAIGPLERLAAES